MKKISRRSFIGSAAGASAAVLTVPALVPRNVLGKGQTPPSGKITLGGIGIGGIGHPQLKSAAAAGFQITALCDIDPKYADKTRKIFPQAAFYRDFRELLDKEGDKVDAIYCGTPDHTHTIITLAALKKKKHVCTVKPLTRTIEECRVIAKAAREAKTATQVTMQPNTSDQACRIMELINAGAIGTVREIHAWSCRPVWPQGMPSLPDFTDPVPKDFDWDAWLGPAKKIPFANEWPLSSPIPKMPAQNWGKRAVYHPFNFRGWTSFGTGSLGDMGCHRANLPYRAFKLKYPTRVSSSSTKAYDVAFPLACIVTYDYPAREDLPELRMIWYDGGLRPSPPKGYKQAQLPAEGVLYVGDKGFMLNDEILDPDRAKKFANVPKTIERRGGVMPEWYEACQGGEPASANFEYAIPVTEFVLLGNLSIQTGKAVEFDPVTMTVKNNPEAQKLIRQPYYNGWKLE